MLSIYDNWMNICFTWGVSLGERPPGGDWEAHKQLFAILHVLGSQEYVLDDPVLAVGTVAPSWAIAELMNAKVILAIIDRDFMIK